MNSSGARDSTDVLGISRSDDGVDNDFFFDDAFFAVFLVVVDDFLVLGAFLVLDAFLVVLDAFLVVLDAFLVLGTFLVAGFLACIFVVAAFDAVVLDDEDEVANDSEAPPTSERESMLFRNCWLKGLFLQI